MKECSACSVVKELNQFSTQKTKPGKLYAWCDECRLSQNDINRKRNQGYAKEMYELKKKAIELRAFSPEEATKLRERYQSGEKVRDLAAEVGRSENSVRSAIKGYKKGAVLKPALKKNPFDA